MTGILFAAAGALGYGIASVLQSVQAHRSTSTLSTLAGPLYVTGLALDLVSWVASLVALRSLPVFEVQAVLAGSLAVTVLVARALPGSRLRRIDAVAIGVSVASLAVVAVSADVRPAPRADAQTVAVLVIAAIVVPVLGVAAAARRSASTSAMAAGLAFGGAALCARVITWPAPGTGGDSPSRLAGALLTQPVLWALAALGVTGMLLYTQALRLGSVGPVTAILWIVEVAVPSVAGALLFGDGVRPGLAVPTVIALIACVAAAAVLAYAPEPLGSPAMTA